jgi:hypothetical protein
MVSDPKKLDCGVIMPLSAHDNCPASHWSDVQEIIFEAIDEAGFSPSMVSDADNSGVIHKRIIENLYNNAIIVCDVSGKNPNVMFELGIRLVFDKPTIIVKDNVTEYSFDTSPIEHVGYPRDLRFASIVEFKEKLSKKIVDKNKEATENPNYTTFLKHFGQFRLPKIEEKEISGQEYILEELRSLRNSIERSARRPASPSRRNPPIIRSGALNACMRNVPAAEIQDAKNVAESYPGVTEAKIQERGVGHTHILIKAAPEIDLHTLADRLYTDYPRPE